MADWCPHPCQLLVLLFQLPFQLPQMFLNVAMAFLSLGAGTSQPPWRPLFLPSTQAPCTTYPGVKVVSGIRASGTETQRFTIILEQNYYRLSPSSSCPGLTLRLMPTRPSQGLQGMTHGKCGHLRRHSAGLSVATTPA